MQKLQGPAAVSSVSGAADKRYQVKPGVWVARSAADGSVDKQHFTPDEVVADLEKQVQEYFTLHRAAYFNKLAQLEALLTKGQDPNQRDAEVSMAGVGNDVRCLYWPARDSVSHSSQLAHNSFAVR